MKNQEDETFEIDEEKYRRDYQKEVERLLKYTELREEMVGLLKIARPGRIAEIREAVAQIDKNIEASEKLMELMEEAQLAKKEYKKNLEKLENTCEIILEGLREHLADDPEKLEQLEAILSDDGKSH